MPNKSEELELAIRRLTRPVAGQYPRPWLIEAGNPTAAKVFLVGYNQARTFPEAALRSHDTYIDALFSRGEESCRALYDRIAGTPSRTRRASDRLVQVLGQHGLHGVLQTNVICYSTPRAADIRAPEHQAGLELGTEIFETLVRIIQPRVLIVHGTTTCRLVEQVLELIPELPEAPSGLGPPVYQDYGHLRIFPIKSLSGAPYNSWKSWAEVYFGRIAEAAARHLGAPSAG